MAVLKKEIPALLENITEKAELLYQQHIPQEDFEKMLIDIQGIVEFFFVYHQENTNFPLDEDHMKEIFIEAVSATEDEDYTLMADLITYDFVDYVNELYKKL